MNAQETTDKSIFTIVREFNAPKELVFNAFSDADALGEWWGPVECTNTVLKLDFRPGGIFHFRMDSHGKISYARFLYRTIQPPDLLEFTNAFADENANIVRAPFGIQLPLEIFYRFIFTEENGKTTITMTGEPVDSTDEERLTFNSIYVDMQKGFGATFDMLAVYLDMIQSNTR